jgi:hypothetical protein
MKGSDNNNYRKLNSQDERRPVLVFKFYLYRPKLKKLLLQSDKSLSQRAKTLV